MSFLISVISWCVVLMLCYVCIASDATPVESATLCLSTLLSVLGEGEDTSSSPLTTLDMARLMSYCSTVMKDEAAAEKISIAMETRGFSICSMKTSKPTNSKPQASELSQTGVEKESMSGFYSLLVRVTVKWLPFPEPGQMVDRPWLETVSTICVTALKIFLNKQRTSNDVEMLLQWFKRWLDSGDEMLKCLTREISETGRKGEGHSVLSSLLDIYTMLSQASEAQTQAVDEDWRAQEISDDIETERLLNYVLVSVAQSLPPEDTTKVPHFYKLQQADRGK